MTETLKQRVIRLLTKWADGFEKLEEAQVKMCHWVGGEGDYDEEKKTYECGTTACLAGWFPVLVPEAGIKIIRRREVLGDNTHVNLYFSPDDPDGADYAEYSSDMLPFLIARSLEIDRRSNDARHASPECRQFSEELYDRLRDLYHAFLLDRDEVTARLRGIISWVSEQSEEVNV